MSWKEEYKPLLWISIFFTFAYFMPLNEAAFRESIYSAFELTKWYAREHVILCLLPAFFIAGVIAVFISQAAVIKYFGAGTRKWIAYGIASVSGTILAVCSCTILPLFSGIHKRGAGLGPAITFLYSGPAINILAIILTARILGLEMGIARVLGAVFFSVIIGMLMHFFYRKEESSKAETQMAMPASEEKRPLWKTAIHFFILVAILVFANWAPTDETPVLLNYIYLNKWMIVSLFGILLSLSLFYILRLNPWHLTLAIALAFSVYFFFHGQPLLIFAIAMVILVFLLGFGTDESKEWLAESWGFAKQILPLLAAGVLVAGFLLGTQNGGKGIIPNEWIAGMVGGNSVFANFFASIVGAFMYFATLTEVPILQGLINAGMGKGPALALLLAGPALSLPNMLVIRDVIGTQKTVVYVSLVVIMATITGIIYGSIF